MKQLARKWPSQDLNQGDVGGTSLVSPNDSSYAASRLSRICPSTWSVWDARKVAVFISGSLKKKNLLGKSVTY